MIIIGILIGFVIGWELRNLSAEYNKWWKKRKAQMARQQRLRSNNTWYQIKRVGPEEEGLRV